MRNAERFSISVVAGLLTSAVLLAGTGCANPGAVQSTTQLSSRVLRLKGEARYSMDEGKTWRAIRSGDVLELGCLVQTATSSHLTIALGERFLFWPPAQSG